MSSFDGPPPYRPTIGGSSERDAGRRGWSGRPEVEDPMIGNPQNYLAVIKVVGVGGGDVEVPSVLK